MEVILLKNVAHLGVLGDKVKVRPGYGRNYLVPGGFAVAATAPNLAAFEERRAELERQAAEQLAAAEARKAQLEGLTLRIVRKAGEQGRLFGSVGTQDIAKALTEQGIEIDKAMVRLAAGALRMAGQHALLLRLHPEVEVTIELDIIGED